MVRKLTPALEAQCNGKSSLGRGGMISKLRAAKLASEGGVHVAIVNGRHPKAITRGHGTQDRNLFSAAERSISNTVRPNGATLTTAASTQEKLLRARAARRKLALLSTEEKNALLLAIADAIEAKQKSILAANREDIENSGLEGAMRDRLLLTPARIKDMAQGVRDVAALPDPIGETLAEWTKSNGLRIRKAARAARRGRNHLRIAPERDRRYRRARAENRQRHRAARRQGSGAQQSAPGRDYDRGSRSSRGRNRIARFQHAPVGARFDQSPRTGRRHHSTRRRRPDHIRHREFRRAR